MAIKLTGNDLNEATEKHGRKYKNIQEATLCYLKRQSRTQKSIVHRENESDNEDVEDLDNKYEEER